MNFIDLTTSEYPELSRFGVLAQTAITCTGTTTVNSGLWGIPSGEEISNIVSGTYPSNLASVTQATTAQTSLSTLINNIRVKTATLPTTLLSATPGDYTFLPNQNYTNTLSNGVSFTNNAITFDACGNTNAQFFITVLDDTVGSGYLEITNTSFNLINQARACNIFFLTDSYITISCEDGTESPIYGNFISGTTGSFSYPSSINGHVYAKTDVSITAQTQGTLLNTLSNIPWYIIR